MESETQNHVEANRETRMIEPRAYPRFKFEVDISVQARHGELLRGRTVDISESGISALLKIEVEVGVVVQLEFSFPLDHISALAVVRQKSAFRYGFQFADADGNRELIRRACDQLVPCP
jgi:c-di-GMP-binding flagellar brake protein YcgR